MKRLLLALISSAFALLVLGSIGPPSAVAFDWHAMLMAMAVQTSKSWDRIGTKGETEIRSPGTSPT